MMDLSFTPNLVYVIIPSYNEEKVILSTISNLIKIGYTVVIVDDCSTDDTEEILKGYPVIHAWYSLIF